MFALRVRMKFSKLNRIIALLYYSLKALELFISGRRKREGYYAWASNKACGRHLLQITIGRSFLGNLSSALSLAFALSVWFRSGGWVIVQAEVTKRARLNFQIGNN